MDEQHDDERSCRLRIFVFRMCFEGGLGRRLTECFEGRRQKGRGFAALLIEISRVDKSAMPLDTMVKEGDC